MAPLDSVPSGTLKNLGTYFSTASVTAYQGTPVHFMPALTAGDGLHPLPAGPIEVFSVGFAAGVCVYVGAQQFRVRFERDVV
jgi:hypothetical protein